MSGELKQLIANVIDGRPDAKSSLIEVGRIFTHHIQILTENELHVFRYFINIKAKNISCTFYCNGSFPVENYEGICSISILPAGIVSASCDLLPFAKGRRVNWSKHAETYININLGLDEHCDPLIEDVFWTGDANHEWAYLSGPRTNLYDKLEYVYDDY